jgi:indolepyruvate ferredoxin oxidoreductase beta subunit
MEKLNIYLAGVGGQGIGLLTEILMRAADHAGIPVKGVDTHGLAQRGGTVISQLRLGDNVHSPLISEGEADMVIALERHEALRAMNRFLKDGGTMAYYNASWQPLEVRLNEAEPVTEYLIHEQCERRNIKVCPVFRDDLMDSRMQNVLLLTYIDKAGLIPDIKTEHYLQALEDLMEGSMLKKNMQLFQGPQESE